MTTNAICIDETGGPEKLLLKEIPAKDPTPGTVRVRHSAIGVNYIDTYFRSGLYPAPMPFTPGMEAAGKVDAIGEGVLNFQIGERVAYALTPGAYATSNLVPADKLVKLPDSVSEEDAAALMLKGMTTQYLFRQTYKLQPGETILFHAAAGGVGLIACQWAKALGVTLIGTAGGPEKCALGKDAGAAHMIDYNRENVVERILELTDGKKVPVVYDGVGKSTFMTSLDCLAPRGLLASFGNASGAVTGVDLGLLAAKGSLYVTRPTLATYTATAEQLKECADDLFAQIASGAVKADIRQRYSLADAAQAHKDLEGRKTTGATLLIP